MRMVIQKVIEDERLEKKFIQSVVLQHFYSTHSQAEAAKKRINAYINNNNNNNIITYL